MQYALSGTLCLFLCIISPAHGNMIITRTTKQPVLEVYFGKSEYWLAFANCMLAKTNLSVNKFLH